MLFYMKTPISVAIEILGSQQALATACGVTQPAVHKWATGKGRPDAKSSIAIERATKGKISRSVLRPDIFEQSSNDVAA